MSASRRDLLCMSVDDCRDDFVFGLEVVIDVADRDVRDLGDVRERCPFDALLVQELDRSGYEALPFPWPSLDRGRLARC